MTFDPASSPAHPWLDHLQRAKLRSAIPIIAEIKPRSEIDGDLLSGRDLGRLIESYVKGGAACLSVVTGRWFGGHLDLLRQVAECCSLPILRKDLIVNQRQIEESKQAGASAVLLTRRLLADTHLKKLIDFALQLELTPFIEVANVPEVLSMSDNARVAVGLANRDIALKEMDRDAGLPSIELRKSLRANVGAIVSASGVSHPAQAVELCNAGFDAILVGTALMKSPDPQAMLATFTALRSDLVKNNT